MFPSARCGLVPALPALRPGRCAGHRRGRAAGTGGEAPIDGAWERAEPPSGLVPAVESVVSALQAGSVTSSLHRRAQRGVTAAPASRPAAVSRCSWPRVPLSGSF